MQATYIFPLLHSSRLEATDTRAKISSIVKSLPYSVHAPTDRHAGPVQEVFSKTKERTADRFDQSEEKRAFSEFSRKKKKKKKKSKDSKDSP
jgi:cell shape-determining protein MreC